MTANSWFMVEIKLPDRPDADKSQATAADGAFFDVTDLVDERITLEETADLLDKLTFTLVGTEEQSIIRFIDTLVEGMEVRAWFGPMDGMKRVNYDTVMFLGYIDTLLPEYPTGGSPRLSITAYDAAWKLSKKKHPVQRVFPEPKKGHRATTINAIVEKVLEPHRDYLDIGRIEIPAKYSGGLRGYVPIVQDTDESDWKFLKRLAHGDEKDGVGGAVSSVANEKKASGFDGCECVVYVELVRDRPTLYFVPESELMSVKSDIQLQYPLFGDTLPLHNAWLSSSGTMFIDSARIDEDRIESDVVKMQVPASVFKNVLKDEEFKKLTKSSESEVVVTQEEFFESFDIDFKAIERDERAGLIPWSLFDFVAGKISYKDVEKYVTLKIEHVPAAHKELAADVPINNEALSNPNTAFSEIEKKLGKKAKRRKGSGSAGMVMTVDLTIGNHNIRPRKVYTVLGLGGKYSSSDKRKWFADTVVHSVGRTYSQQIKFTM